MQLTVQVRDKFGRQTKALRREGLIPAELYGRGIANIHLAVPVKEFRRAFREAGESTVLTLEIATEKGSDMRSVMIHEVQRDPLRDEIVNIDFYQVRLDEKIKVKVPLVFTDVAPAVKEKDGIVVKSIHELEVEALPNKLPHELKVSLAAMKEIGTSVYARDIVVPDGVRIMAPLDTALATVIAKPTEEEEQKLTEEVKVETIKAEGDEKKAEREKTTAPEAKSEATTPVPEKKAGKK